MSRPASLSAATGTPYQGLHVEPVSTVDRIAEELRRALFEGELEPGTPLREVALAAQLGVARSTVREALGMLVADGLADRIPNRGTVVHQLTAEGIADVGRARAVLEGAGVAHWSQAEEADRDAVRAALAEFTRLSHEQASSQELTAAHLAVHRALAGLAGSPRLLATADGLYSEIRLALAGVDRARRNAAEQAAAHTALVDLLEAGDVEAAQRALADHLDGAVGSMLAAVGPASPTLGP